MAIAFTGTGGLFTRLGKVAKIGYILRSNQSTLNTNLEAIRTALEAGTALTEPLNNFDNTVQASIAQNQGYMPYMQALAQSIVIRTVFDDNPSQANSLFAAMREVIRQMVAATETVKRCTVGNSTSTSSTNQGDGVIYASTTNWDGTPLEWVYPETTVQLRCTADSQTGGATEGNEIFTYTGEPYSQTGINSVWNQDYPLGSGQTTRLTAISPTSGSYIGEDGEFDDFETTGSLGPTGWTVLVGTNPTNFQKDTTTYYSGTASLKLIAGATLQSFTYEPSLAFAPMTVSVVNLRLKASASLTGNLRISVTNSAGTVVTGGDGNPMQVDIDLSTVGTSSFGSYGGTFYFPRSIPDGALIKMAVTTAISGGNLNIDRMVFFDLTDLYSAGPKVGIVSGATKFVENDLFFLTTTNNFAGASDLGTWQWAWERLLTPTARSFNLYLPSTAGVPTIADTLITA